LAVKEEFQRKGVGRAILKFMQQHSDEVKPHLLPKMHAQLQALPFYQALGWQSCGTEFEEAGIPHVTMIRPPADARKLKAMTDTRVPPYIQNVLQKA
jgi:predicted GNAT family N-acyltransferase